MSTPLSSNIKVEQKGKAKGGKIKGKCVYTIKPAKSKWIERRKVVKKSDKMKQKEEDNVCNLSLSKINYFEEKRKLEE